MSECLNGELPSCLMLFYEFLLPFIVISIVASISLVFPDSNLYLTVVSE